jgi:hypothetical protein
MISASSSFMKPWSNMQLTAKALDEKGNFILDNNINWSSSDNTIASISKSGLITSNLIGKVTIIATIQDVKAIFNLEIKNETDVYVSENVILDTLNSGSETSIAINPLNPLNLVVSTNFSHYYTFDGGRNWGKRYISGLGPTADPNVSFLPDGTLLRQGMTLPGGNNPRGISVQKSFDGGKTINSEPDMTYKPLKDQGNADQGIINTDNYEKSKFYGASYLIFSDYPKEAPSYMKIGFALLFQKADKNGLYWSSPKDISSCTDCGQEHSSYISSGPNGEIYATWWNGKGQVVFNSSFNGGYTWGKETVVRTPISRLNKFKTSDDVRGNLTIDVDKSEGLNHGTIYICGMDRNSQLGGAADAWIVRSSDLGNSWSQPTLLSDGPQGSNRYYFQPRISVSPNGRVDAIWYDTRNWIGNDINAVEYDIYYAYSVDGAKSFSKNYRVTKSSKTKFTSCPTQEPCGQRVLYEYIGLKSDLNRALAVWTSINENNIDKPAFATIWVK